jgi:phosphatidylglycerol:prolipoprotein diacylglycerol transferase
VITFPDIDPVAFSLGPLSVHWYGIMYVFGFIAGWFGMRWSAGKPGSPIAQAEVEDLLFYVALGVFVGGRIGYVLLYMVFYDLPRLLAEPWVIFYIHEGGMSFHGGLLGVIVALALFARRRGHGFFTVTDFVAPWIAPGTLFVRFGNFINGELWGKVTDVPWAVVYEGLPRHPNQIYEALLEGAVMFVVLMLWTRKPRPRMTVSGLYLVLYGVFRIGIEFIRVPDNEAYLAFGWLTRGIVYSVPMVILGIALLVLAYRRPAAGRAVAA